MSKQTLFVLIAQVDEETGDVSVMVAPKLEVGDLGSLVEIDDRLPKRHHHLSLRGEMKATPEGWCYSFESMRGKSLGAALATLAGRMPV